jgi:hypothetical protein
MAALALSWLAAHVEPTIQCVQLFVQHVHPSDATPRDDTLTPSFNPCTSFGTPVGAVFTCLAADQFKAVAVVALARYVDTRVGFRGLILGGNSELDPVSDARWRVEALAVGLYAVGITVAVELWGPNTRGLSRLLRCEPASLPAGSPLPTVRLFWRNRVCFALDTDSATVLRDAARAAGTTIASSVRMISTREGSGGDHRLPVKVAGKDNVDAWTPQLPAQAGAAELVLRNELPELPPHAALALMVQRVQALVLRHPESVSVAFQLVVVVRGGGGVPVSHPLVDSARRPLPHFHQHSHASTPWQPLLAPLVHVACAAARHPRGGGGMGVAYVRRRCAPPLT